MAQTRSSRCRLPKTTRSAACVVGLAVGSALGLAGAERFLPVQHSEACARCHAADGNNTFEQWLASPYSDRDGGVPCQGCHRDSTLPLECRASSASDAGAVAPPDQPARRAAELRVAARGDDGVVTVEVAVCNLGAGHELPTGARGTAVVLLVEASALKGGSLARLAGPLLPDTADELAGRPGVVYTAGRSGLPPFATDVTRYMFAGACAGEIRIEATLLSRRSPLGSMAGALRETVIASASTTLRRNHHAVPTR
jgi:hypothetical protein